MNEKSNRSRNWKWFGVVFFSYLDICFHVLQNKKVKKLVSYLTFIFKRFSNSIFCLLKRKDFNAQDKPKKVHKHKLYARRQTAFKFKLDVFCLRKKFTSLNLLCHSLFVPQARYFISLAKLTEVYSHSQATLI